MTGQPMSARDRLHQMITAVAQREYEDSITTLGTVAHPEHIGSRIAAEIINLFDRDDTLYRSLLPAGTRTEEQFAALCTLDGEMVSPYPEPTTLPGAEVRVKGNNVQRAVDPDWRVDCTVVRRQQYTTPWEPVDATCGKPGEYWPTGSLRIDLEPCDRQPGHTGRCNWKLPEGLPADIPPPSEETL